MERYPIPQFIESEAKIIFFLSFKQFFTLVGAGVLCFFVYFSLPRDIFYVVAVLIFAGAAAISFVTINGMPIINFLLSLVGFSMGGKNYTWKKKESLYPFKPIQRTQIRKIEQGPVLQAQTSQLRKTKTSVELKTK